MKNHSIPILQGSHHKSEKQTFPDIFLTWTQISLTIFGTLWEFVFKFNEKKW